MHEKLLCFYSFALNSIWKLVINMDKSLSQHFSLICGELCNLLYVKDYKKADINSLIDELNTKPFKAEFFVRKHVSMLRLLVRPHSNKCIIKVVVDII